MALLLWLTIVYRYTFCYIDNVIMCYPLCSCNSDYQVHVMECVPYVGWPTCSRATVMTHFMFSKKKKEKKKGHHNDGLGSNGCFVTGTPCLNGGHGYGFGSSVGHPRSDLVRLLVYDGMRTYPKHRCCIRGPSGQHQPCREEVNILGRLYGINYDIYV